MADNNYENLGFQVKVDGADGAVSNLDRIVERLERIQKLQGGGTSKSSSKLLSEEEKYTQRVARSTQLLNSAKHEELRRTELANQQRKKEIGQRLKQELGIQDTTNALGKYLTKLSSALVIARKFAHFMADAIQESAEYTENLNLFAVAFGESYQEQLNWALGIADAYGLANNEVVKFAGTFRELSTSLGVVAETADIVSQTVVKLGYDLSALYNTSVENAMQALQSSVFAGQTKPLRRFGIDISQNQINALFETSEALASIGANARNLTQSDKAIARLIITLQSGGDSFGTMAREINNLQSQIRIFQGSLSNFKLAIGDMFEKPISRVMVLANAAVIAMTDIIRAFVPLETTDETTKVKELGADAEYASDEMDKLNGKLAGFDKFNVLTETKGDGSSLAITEALNKMLEEQVALYDQDLSKAMEEMKNKATDLADKIKPLVVIFGVLVAKFAVNKFIGMAKGIGELSEKIKGFTQTTTILNKGLKLTNTLLVAGLIYAVYQAVKAFKDGDKAAGWIAVTIGVALVGALVSLNLETIKTIGLKLKDWFMKAGDAAVEATWKWALSEKSMKTQALTAKQVGVALGAMAASYFLVDSIINAFGEENRKVASTCFLVAGGIMAIVAAVLSLNHVMSWGTALPMLLAGVGAAIAGVKGLTTELKGFKDGGYTNANLIMTHENGKREWVGKAAGSSAIVNDTQMSDIMETAVAKGVYRALSSSRTDGGSGGTTKNVYNFQVNGRTLLSVMEDEARKQGKTLARI